MSTIPDQIEFVEVSGSEVRYQYKYYTIIEDGYANCYIPAFDLYFFAKEGSDVGKVSNTVTNAFFMNLAEQGRRALYLKLHAFGFRMNSHDATLKNLLKGKEVGKAKFKSTGINRPPVGYTQSAKMESVAVFP